MPRSPHLCQRVALLFIAGLVLAPAPSGAEADPARAVLHISVSEAEGTVVEIWADGAIQALDHFSMSDPSRLVVDFPGLHSELVSHDIPVANAEVERIRVGRHRDKVRVVIEVADGVLADARLARSDRGVALVFGDAEVPDLMAGTTRVTERPVVSAAPAPVVQRRGSSDELSRAAKELAAAARELSAAAQELRQARAGIQAAAPVAAATPTPRTPRSPSDAPRSAMVESRASAERSAAETAAAARALQGATREVERAMPAVAARPPSPSGSAIGLDSPYPLTYTGVMQWLEDHRTAAPSFVPGDVVRQADLSRLRPFLPPGYYEEFDFPGTQLQIQMTASLSPHESYQRATLQYQGQTSIAPDGSLEHYIAGRPFSDERILAAPPRDGGLMVGWNNIFRWQHFGYRAGPIPMAYMAPGDEVPRERAAALSGGGRVERVLVTEYQRVYLSHQAVLEDQDYTLKVADADTQHFKDWMQFTEPFDMRGTAFVIERYRDPHEPDQVNSYLPTERKIRRLSAKERSDRFLGSEMTLDDFEGFSGRVLDYDWQYRGQKHVLHVVDSRNPHSVFFGPMSHVPNDHWQLRRCHVVETRPVLPGHPHARKLNFYDAENYNIPMALVFDGDDQLLKVIYTIYKWPGGSPSDDPSTTVSHYRSSVVINKQSKRSMVNWSESTEIPDMKASTVRRLFNVSTLTGGR